MTVTGETRFSEVMEGTCQVEGEADPRELRLELDVTLPGILHPLMDARASMRGTVHAPGWAHDTDARGTMHAAPFSRRRIRYQIDFVTLDGRRMHLDGWKSIRYRRLYRSMTTLPATVTDESGAVVAQALVRFHSARRLLPMLTSVRYGRRDRGSADPQRALAPRWNGKAGRLEVWYSTLTDPATGTGVWLHHELVAPTDGARPYVHGWAAVFPPEHQPSFARFGPHPWRPPEPGGMVTSDAVTVTPERLVGTAGDIEWDLSVRDASPPLFTFGRWAWDSGLLPAAQIVPQPGARYAGTIRSGGDELRLDDARGATAHIYGHGNAHRWAWLHADLGDGDVAEVVAAVPRKPGLRVLPPLPFVRMRIDGRDWPADSLLAAARLRADVRFPTWRVAGTIGSDHVTIEVTQPEDGTVTVPYTDPDGAPATCRNSERADATIRLQRRRAGRWEPYREWRLTGTAHAEVGSRDE